MILKYIFPLFVGALIGYITNWIAIRMLFRPYKEKYIGKIRVPFTPGLIPKERNRISKSISTTIGEYLLTDEILIRELKSEKIINGLSNFIFEQIKKINVNKHTILDITKKLFNEKTDVLLEEIVGKIKKSITNMTNDIEYRSKLQIYINNMVEKKLMGKSISEVGGINFGENLRRIAELISPTIIIRLKEIANSNEVKNKINTTIRQEIDKKLGGMGFLGMLGAGIINSDNICATVVNKIEEVLDEEETKERINTFIISYIMDYKDEKISTLIPEEFKYNMQNNIGDAISDSISSHHTIELINEIVEKKVKEILNYKIVIPDTVGNLIVENVLSFYDMLVLKYAKKIILSIDIAKIIEREINTFDIKYLEEIILKVAKKELSAITKLGALIGFVLAGILLLIK
jgi:uncharacterized membrane protein YheB (UPF0754 family)